MNKHMHRDAHGDNVFLHQKLLRNYVAMELEGIGLKARWRIRSKGEKAKLNSHFLGKR